MSTHELPVEKGWIDWCEPLAFDISLENIPRATKLCFALYVVIDRQVDKQQKGKNNTTQKKAKQKKQASVQYISNAGLPSTELQMSLIGAHLAQTFMATFMGSDTNIFLHK